MKQFTRSAEILLAINGSTVVIKPRLLLCCGASSIMQESTVFVLADEPR